MICEGSTSFCKTGLWLQMSHRTYVPYDLRRDHTDRSELQRCRSSPPLRVAVRPTSFEKMKAQLQCTSRHSLTAEMRLEALKAHGTWLWSTTSERATRQLLLCYQRKPNQSAACCSLRLNCTTMFQILVRSAVYTRTVHGRQESRKMHANASASSPSDFCRQKIIMCTSPGDAAWIISSIDLNCTVCGGVV